MTNYNHFRIINDLTGLANKLGFEIKPNRGAFNSYAYEQNSGSDFSLTIPDDDGTILPIYSRNVTIYSGSAEDCIHFMHGWMKHREYMNILGFKDKTVADREKKIVDQRKMDRMTKAVIDGKDPGANHWHDSKDTATDRCFDGEYGEDAPF